MDVCDEEQGGRGALSYPPPLSSSADRSCEAASPVASVLLLPRSSSLTIPLVLAPTYKDPLTHRLMQLTPENIASIVAGTQVSVHQTATVALLGAPSHTTSSKRVVIVAQSSEGWCVAVGKGAPEAHVVYFAEPRSTRTTPRWRGAVPDEPADAPIKPRPASETAVRALLPRFELAFAATSTQPAKLAWDLVALPCPPLAQCIPEVARVLLIAAWSAHSNLSVKGQLKRLDKLHFVPDWKQGLAELERGCWYGPGIRVELTPAQADRREREARPNRKEDREDRGEDRGKAQKYQDSVYATRAEIEWLWVQERGETEKLVEI